MVLHVYQQHGRLPERVQDKIVISDYVRFSHPSYSQALTFLLLEDGVFTQINTEAFSKVLSKLSRNIDSARDVLNFITDNFEKLPKESRNLLLQLGERYVAVIVPYAVAKYFDKLPDKGRNELPLKLEGGGWSCCLCRR